MAYLINQDKCTSCGACKDNCPVDCITEAAGVYTIVADECVDCGTCEANCPADAITQA